MVIFEGTKKQEDIKFIKVQSKVQNKLQSKVQGKVYN